MTSGQIIRMRFGRQNFCWFMLIAGIILSLLNGINAQSLDIEKFRFNQFSHSTYTSFLTQNLKYLTAFLFTAGRLWV